MKAPADCSNAMPFRVARAEGLHYPYLYQLRGKWKLVHVFGETLEQADQKAIAKYSLLFSGAVREIRQGRTRKVIYVRPPKARQTVAPTIKE